jgi:hypothetical protein
MNLFTRNSPYYHLLKHLRFLLKHPVYTVVALISLYNIFCFSLRLFPSYVQNTSAHHCLKMVSPATEECVLSYHSFAQHCHNSKGVIFQEKFLKVLKCYNFLRVQRRHNCSSAASFANCVMTLYLLKVHLQTFLSIAITQKCQILSRDTLVANERCMFYKLNLKSETMLLAAVAGDI